VLFGVNVPLVDRFFFLCIRVFFPPVPAVWWWVFFSCPRLVFFLIFLRIVSSIGFSLPGFEHPFLTPWLLFDVPPFSTSLFLFLSPPSFFPPPFPFFVCLRVLLPDRALCSCFFLIGPQFFRFLSFFSSLVFLEVWHLGVPPVCFLVHSSAPPLLPCGPKFVFLFTRPTFPRPCSQVVLLGRVFSDLV